MIPMLGELLSSNIIYAGVGLRLFVLRWGLIRNMTAFMMISIYLCRSRCEGHDSPQSSDIKKFELNVLLGLCRYD